MTLIEPPTISAAALPSSVLPFGSWLLLTLPLMSLLGIAAIGLWYAQPRHQKLPCPLPLRQSTAA